MLIAHSGGVYLLVFARLVIADLVGGCEGDGTVILQDSHHEILIAVNGFGREGTVGDVFAGKHYIPLIVAGCPIELCSQFESGIYIINALYRMRLEKRIENQAKVLITKEFRREGGTQYFREASPVEGQVEEMAALVLAVIPCCEHVPGKPLACTESG